MRKPPLLFIFFLKIICTLDFTPVKFDGSNSAANAEVDKLLRPSRFRLVSEINTSEASFVRVLCPKHHYTGGGGCSVRQLRPLPYSSQAEFAIQPKILPSRGQLPEVLPGVTVRILKATLDRPQTDLSFSTKGSFQRYEVAICSKILDRVTFSEIFQPPILLYHLIYIIILNIFRIYSF